MLNMENKRKLIDFFFSLLFFQKNYFVICLLLQTPTKIKLYNAKRNMPAN